MIGSGSLLLGVFLDLLSLETFSFKISWMEAETKLEPKELTRGCMRRIQTKYPDHLNFIYKFWISFPTISSLLGITLPS